MTDNEWRKKMAKLDGWTYHSGQEIKENVRPWEDCRGQFTWDPLPYDTLEDMLRVCKKQGWTAQILQWNDGKVHATIELNRETGGVAKADTPQAALRAAIEQVIGGGDG